MPNGKDPQAIPRPIAGQERRPDYIHGFRRLLYENLMWPMLAVFMLGLIGYLLTPASLKSVWLLWAGLAIIGGFLSIQWAVALGALVFVSAVPWLFTAQPGGGVTGELFLVFALLPFAPLWLAATRAHHIRAARLHVLLELPQVRSAMDVSDWSLMPTPRAIDRRLRQYLAEQRRSGRNDPALVYRIRFHGVDRAEDLLGTENLQELILELANQLRDRLRTGDMIAEDVRNEGVLYVLAFPNPEHPTNEAAVAARLRPLIERLGLPEWEMQVACIPEDGEQVHALQWRSLE